MCGIVGILSGSGDVVHDLLAGLKRLEYRGYDGAGIATLLDGQLQRRRAHGKLSQLVDAVDREPISGQIGIGHTRWATHGAPSTSNCHPHISGNVAVVHNGIIENHAELKAHLQSSGRNFTSDTDTEVIAHLCDNYLSTGLSPEEAVCKTLSELQGAYAICFLFAQHSDLMIVARQGPPLLIGYGEQGMYVSSAAIAILPFTQNVCYLEEGDYAILTSKSAEIRNSEGVLVKREIRKMDVQSDNIAKNGYRYFMDKEIHEQPELLGYALGRYFTEDRLAIEPQQVDFSALARLHIVGCGTANYAGMVGKYWFEQLGQMAVEVDIGSEFRYRAPVIEEPSAALFISQSGETADTLAALHHCQEIGIPTIALLNAMDSSMAHIADIALPIYAGTEIGVASTKAFSCQLAVLACLAIQCARQRGHMLREQESILISQMSELPRLFGQLFKLENHISQIAQEISEAKGCIYIGRNVMYPLALEGALKLKELSYLPSEGCAAGELKHGPLALVEENTPVVALAPSSILFEKTASNIEEVHARKGKVILISDEEGTSRIGKAATHKIILPDCAPIIAPMLYAAPLQLLAYYTAVALGHDVDQPRNLAKSVTVE